MIFLFEKNMDYGPYDMNGFDPGFNDSMMNPMMQYEQSCMYYRYLTQVMEYKIKCKEYEKLSGGKTETQRRVE